MTDIKFDIHIYPRLPASFCFSMSIYWNVISDTPDMTNLQQTGVFYDLKLADIYIEPSINGQN